VFSGLTILGQPPLAHDGQGKLISRIGTVFPRQRILVTLRGPHATQRWAFIEHLNQNRQQRGQEPLTAEEESDIWNSAVDLIMEGDTVLIRPNPDEMPLAFEADTLLQTLVPKHHIRFLCALNQKVRAAVTQRGECWRVTHLPTSRTEMKQRILASKLGLGGREIYYYSSITGTRYLTLDEFAGLSELDDDALRQHLEEIREFSTTLNPRHAPEIAFFMADDSFSGAELIPYSFATMPGVQLRAVHEELVGRFEQSVPPELRDDDLEDATWRNRMFSALVSEDDELVSEEMLLGLSPEFFMQIRWLPGGRIINGDLLFDEVFEDETATASGLCDDIARELLYNLVREYDDLEYVNIGRVVNSLSRGRDCNGRRDVYIAVIRQRRQPEETVSIIRLQKWGVREHLDNGVPQLRAMYDSEEYTEYVLDRRLGCRHLGMNIITRFSTRKICERYYREGFPAGGITIWSPYFERPYIRGVATDKVPVTRLSDPRFTVQLAQLLGSAAAPNLIVGRSELSGKVLFDDGDEVLLLDEDGLPHEIVVGDQTGTFVDFETDLRAIAPAYADPVNRRLNALPNPEEFAEAYLDGFVQRFTAIQQKYRKRHRAFDRLFKNRPYDIRGSFAYRWERVLKRLNEAVPEELAAIMRERMRLSVPCT
jgi:hypothetical protein